MMSKASLDPYASSIKLPEGVPYRLSAEDYVRMVDVDIIPLERRVGVWNGQLYEKMPKTLAHCTASSLISSAVIRAMPEGWCTWTNASIIVDEYTVPFPDLSLVRGDPDVYCRRGSFP